MCTGTVCLRSCFNQRFAPSLSTTSTSTDPKAEKAYGIYLQGNLAHKKTPPPLGPP